MRDIEFVPLANAYNEAFEVAMRNLGVGVDAGTVCVKREHLEANDVQNIEQAADLARFDAARVHRENSAGSSGKDVVVDLPTGRKDDAFKPDWSLLPLKAVEEVVKVLSFGAKKYQRDNWVKVPDGEHRYLAAALRHLAAHQAGERSDSESGESHLAHAACCILFLIHKQLEVEKL